VLASSNRLLSGYFERSRSCQRIWCTRVAATCRAIRANTARRNTAITFKLWDFPVRLGRLLCCIIGTFVTCRWDCKVLPLQIDKN